MVWRSLPHVAPRTAAFQARAFHARAFHACCPGCTAPSGQWTRLSGVHQLAAGGLRFTVVGSHQSRRPKRQPLDILPSLISQPTRTNSGRLGACIISSPSSIPRRTLFYFMRVFSTTLGDLTSALHITLICTTILNLDTTAGTATSPWLCARTGYRRNGEPARPRKN